jgi:hypothetical protein
LLPLSALAKPGPPNASGWDAPAASLVKKIVAAIENAKSLSLDVQNLSSLGPASVSEIRTAIESDLTHSGVNVQASGDTNDSAVITLSENALEFVWVAKIHHGGSEKIAIVDFPRGSAPPDSGASEAITLQRQIVWQQPEPLLDFAMISDADGNTSVIVLEPARLSLHGHAGSAVDQTLEFPAVSAAPRQRDPKGRIDVASGTADVPGVKCSGGFDHFEQIQCVAAPQSKTIPDAFSGYTIVLDGRNVEAAKLGNACGSEPLVLASGTGDWTTQDNIRAYALAENQPSPVGSVVHFTGPVLAIWPSDDGKSARVISRNLETGMYEASIVSVTCAR